MQSRTKYQIDSSGIVRLFEAAGIPNVRAVAPLGDGEFNAVFSVEADGREYVVKIAPPDDLPVLAYESNMMEAEVYWYKALRERAGIRVPEVVFSDFSRTALPVPYCIMERLPGRPLHKARLTPEERAWIADETARMAARMHAVPGERYGYLQNGLHDTWHAAIRSMSEQLVFDCRRVHRRSRRGERLLCEIDRFRAVLDGAPCRLVNFDLWAPNTLVWRADGALRLGWIDPERSFWGDPLADFVCLGFSRPLEQAPCLAAYNAAAETPVLAAPEERVRHAILQGYLALVMETEKYYRYTPFQFGWWRNVAAAGMLYCSAFRTLKAHAALGRAAE